MRVLVVAVLFLAACASGPATSTPAPSQSAPASATPDADASSPAAPTPSAPPTGWRSLETSGGPAPREDHTWTMDGDGSTAYLFGGRDPASGRVFADLWGYDLAAGTWRELADGPPDRFGHNAAWVPGTGLVIFAGQAEATFFADLWAYDPAANAWRQLPGGGARPVARYGSCAALGPDGRLWISHGFTAEGSRFSDTRAYDFATDAWSDETPVGEVPVVRCLHGCWWTADGRFTLYGGQTTGATALDDWWTLTAGPRPGTGSWKLVETGLAPAARNLYGAARWGDGTVVFGGQALDKSRLADTWLLADDGTVTQLLAGAAAPQARSGSELIADPARGRLLLFGGWDGSAALGDLWELTLP